MEESGLHKLVELQVLRRRRFELEECPKAIELSRRIIGHEFSLADSVSERAYLLKALVFNERYSDALEVLEDYLNRLKDMDDWYRCGYGREAAKICFELASQPFPDAKKGLSHGQKLTKKLTMVSLEVLEKAVLATRATENFLNAGRYEAKARSEANRIGQ